MPKQLRALGMLNIRGERSVTCKGAFDRHPSEGPLPAGAPPVCEEFRKQPDALERAAELDAQYGRKPDLAKMPMYCIPFSFKDPYDTKDMRSTGGGDARYDMDFPARDQTLVAQLRAKGAIIYAKANTTEYNGRAGNPGGTNFPTKVLPSTLGYQRSTWAGNPCESYDTTRAASIGSSSGSGVSVGANLVDVQPLRGDRAVVPRSRQSQLGGAHPAAQGDALVPRRGDRLEHLQRPGGHSLPERRRRRQGPRRAQGPGERLLRFRATSSRPSAGPTISTEPLRRRRSRPARRARSRGCASASSVSSW